jgi:hypothetical protein
MESLLLASRVGVSRMSMAQKFLFSKDISCSINVDSQPLSRKTFRVPEGDMTYVRVREMMDVQFHKDVKLTGK